jgi:hypothetical protein
LPDAPEAPLEWFEIAIRCPWQLALPGCGTGLLAAAELPEAASSETPRAAHAMLAFFNT